VAADLSGLMNETFNRVGLVLLRNTDLTDMRQLRQLATLVMKQEQLYEGGSNNRDPLDKDTRGVYNVGAPSSAWLHYHHEMTYIESSVDMLGFLCRKAPKGDRALAGATFVSESIGVTDFLLQTDFGKRLRDKVSAFGET